MAKRSHPKRAKKESHVAVKELPDGQREVTVDGHTWIEGPYSEEAWRAQTKEGQPVSEIPVPAESPGRSER